MQAGPHGPHWKCGQRQREGKRFHRRRRQRHTFSANGDSTPGWEGNSGEEEGEDGDGKDVEGKGGEGEGREGWKGEGGEGNGGEGEAWEEAEECEGGDGVMRLGSDDVGWGGDGDGPPLRDSAA